MAEASEGQVRGFTHPSLVFLGLATKSPIFTFKARSGWAEEDSGSGQDSAHTPGFPQAPLGPLRAFLVSPASTSVGTWICLKKT
jgi:hypothetical protein